MPPRAQIIPGDEVNDFILNSWRPAGFNRNGHPVDGRDQLMLNSRTIQANAFLNREEWESLDQVVYEMAKLRLNAYADVVAAGLTRPSSLATLHTKWRVASERIAADVTMDFRTRRTLDRTDKKTYGQPLPIISAAYSIGRRELIVARAAGQAVDTFEAGEAGAAVAEEAENLLMNGNTTIVVDGSAIYGYRTLAARYTATAAAVGGGDFGTISNIRDTFLGAIAAMAAIRYYGPFNCYIHNTQYHQMLARYSDGSAQTALDTVLALPQIASVKPNDLIATAGDLVMAQLTRNVVDIEVGLTMENRQWESPDGSELHFVAVMSAVPRIKTDYEANAGVAHITGC